VSRRFAAFSPGVRLGETAMLDRGGRTADATADTDTEIYALMQSALDTLAGSEPEIGARLYRNIAIHRAAPPGHVFAKRRRELIRDTQSRGDWRMAETGQHRSYPTGRFLSSGQGHVARRSEQNPCNANLVRVHWDQFGADRPWARGV